MVGTGAPISGKKERDACLLDEEGGTTSWGKELVDEARRNSHERVGVGKLRVGEEVCRLRPSQALLWGHEEARKSISIATLVTKRER